MEIKNQISYQVSKMKEGLLKTLRPFKGLAILTIVVGLFGSGYLLGSRAFETGNATRMSGATVFVTGTCTLKAIDQDRLPSLLNDEVTVTSMDESANTLTGIIVLTREEIVCNLGRATYTALPLLSKIGKLPSQAPALTAAQVVRKLDPEWKKLDKQTLLISGTCRDISGKEISPNLLREKIEITSVYQPAQAVESDEFNLTGIRVSDRQSIICNSKVIKYEIYDPSKDIVEEKPLEKVDYTGKIVQVDSKCKPDPKYLKERPIDPKTKKPIGKIPKFYNLLNTPVQVLKYTTNEKDEILYLEGKIVDRSEPDAYGNKIICDSKEEILRIKYVDSNTSLINKKGQDVNPAEMPKNLEMVTDGEDPVKKVEDQPVKNMEDSQLQDVLKELDK